MIDFRTGCRVLQMTRKPDSKVHADRSWIVISIVRWYNAIMNNGTMNVIGFKILEVGIENQAYHRSAGCGKQ